MDHLIKIGLMERNPRHGHPLRPEFRLTVVGKDAAELAHQIRVASGDENHDLVRKSWTLPVLASLHILRNFNDIRRNLNTITDRALSQSLRSMEERNWVRRDVDDTARPPRSIYSAVNTGAKISVITGSQVNLAQAPE
jgi:DNA-binding HxlR family transcriptional regulator